MVKFKVDKSGVKRDGYVLTSDKEADARKRESVRKQQKTRTANGKVYEYHPTFSGHAHTRDKLDKLDYFVVCLENQSNEYDHHILVNRVEGSRLEFKPAHLEYVESVNILVNNSLVYYFKVEKYFRRNDTLIVDFDMFFGSDKKSKKTKPKEELQYLGSLIIFDEPTLKI